MIDFRYHIVSIVGIFLALAIGLVLGTTTLDPVLTHNLSSNIKTLTAEKQSLRDQLSTAQGDLSQAGSFISAVEAPLIAGRLTGHKVLVISAPNAPSSLRTKMTKAISDAGGVVTGQIGITADYLDPVNQTRLGDVVNSVAPGTVTLPTGGTSGQRAAQLLATLLLSKTPLESADPQTTAALLALSQAKFLHLISAQDTQADLALVISDDGSTDKASPSPSATPAPSDDALIDLVGAGDSAGSGVVIAGSSNVAKGSLLSAVRASGTSDAVSTVDSADSPQGTVQVVYALAAQLRGVSGAYGADSGSDLPLPTPAP
ncbi:copper transporter [Acidothermaceae bacterium B102]|nr:copper transporter [Acidothermaceae bacterium B102]